MVYLLLIKSQWNHYIAANMLFHNMLVLTQVFINGNLINLLRDFFLIFTKIEVLSKYQMYGEIAASDLLKLFTDGSLRCH